MNLHEAAIPALENPLAFIARPTPQLRAAVAQQHTALPAADFAGLLATIRSIFDKYTARLREFPSGSERARALHRMLDKEMAATNRLPLSCGQGCTGCCHYEVEVTDDEVALLQEAVLGGLAIDEHRLAAQAARPRRSAEWHRFGHHENRCVFLGDGGACRVYADRPSICRKHVVTTPAAACTTPGAAVAPVQVLLAEILLSAGLSLDGTEFGSLAKMLARALSTPVAPAVALPA